MKTFEVFIFINQFGSPSEERLMNRLNAGWKVENSCYIGSNTAVYVLSKEE